MNLKKVWFRTTLGIDWFKDGGSIYDRGLPFVRKTSIYCHLNSVLFITTLHVASFFFLISVTVEDINSTRARHKDSVKGIRFLALQRKEEMLSSLILTVAWNTYVKRIRELEKYRNSEGIGMGAHLITSLISKGCMYIHQYRCGTATGMTIFTSADLKITTHFKLHFFRNQTFLNLT